MKQSIAFTPILLAVVIAGCATAKPVTVVSAAPMSDVFDCVIRALNEHGFTITESQRDGGLIKAEKQIGGASAMLAGTAYYTQLTVSTYRGADGKTDLRIVPERMKTGAGGGRVPAGMATPKSDEDEARMIADACAGTSAG